VSASRTLGGRGQGGEEVGEEVERLEDAPRRDKGVVDSVKNTVFGFDVGHQELGVEVELDRYIVSRVYEQG